MLKKIVLATFLFFLSALTSAQTPTANPALNTPADYFKIAKQQTDIRQSGAIPFRMEATFTVTSAVGDKRSGTYSEIWVSPERWRRDIVVDDYHQSSACVSGSYYHQATSEAVDAAAVEVLGNFTPYIQPVEDEARVNQEWKLTIEKLGGVPLAQVTRPPPANAPTGSVATKYFFEPRSGYVRGMQIGQTISYNNFYLELGRIVAHSVSITSPVGKHSIDIAITKFQSAGSPGDDAFAIAGAASSKCLPLPIVPGILNGRGLKKSAPQYPTSARQAHRGGTVELLVTIGTDGHVKNIKTIGQPQSDLAMAAIDALKQYIYEPYLLDGIPAEINREIGVTFQTSP